MRNRVIEISWIEAPTAQAARELLEAACVAAELNSPVVLAITQERFSDTDMIMMSWSGDMQWHATVSFLSDLEGDSEVLQVLEALPKSIRDRQFSSEGDHRAAIVALADSGNPRAALSLIEESAETLRIILADRPEFSEVEAEIAQMAVDSIPDW